VSHSDLLSPLCNTIQSTDKPEVAESALWTLNSVLEGSGHHLTGPVWSLVVLSLQSLSGEETVNPARASSTWSECCTHSFRCLKLIVDNFIDDFRGASKENLLVLSSLLDCCSSFGQSRQDLNTSLTAIGLMWTISDQAASSDVVQYALANLTMLSSDTRPEVRNAAVNTLFSCISGRGSSFTTAQWEAAFTERILPFYESINSKTCAVDEPDSKAEDSSSRYKVSLHHTRNSSSKQWLSTQVLVLRGTIRVLKVFITTLLNSLDEGDAKDVKSANKGKDTKSNKIDNNKNNNNKTGAKANRSEEDDGEGSSDDDDGAPWFQDVWVRLLDFGYEAAIQNGEREILDLRLTGVDILLVCCQLVSAAGIDAANSPARVSTNMEVVNGALREVEATKVVAPSSKPIVSPLSATVDAARQKLFVEAFESLESFRDVFVECEAIDDFYLQVLNKFASGLMSVYECCRQYELSSQNATIHQLYLAEFVSNGDTSSTSDTVQVSDSLEVRFTSLMHSVLKKTTRATKVSYLNQAQRASLDALELMATNGSLPAFRQLIEIAEIAFCTRRDTENDEQDHSQGDNQSPTCDLLQFEASVCVSKAIMKTTVSDQCKLYVFCKVVSYFNSMKEEQRQGKRYYKRFIPIISEGLQACHRSTSEIAESKALTDNKIQVYAWEQFCQCLANMLDPLPIGKDVVKIPRVMEVSEIVQLGSDCITPYGVDGFCDAILDGARHAFGVAEQSTPDHLENGDVKKLNKHREEAVQLFALCFKILCKQRPDHASVRVLVHDILSLVTAVPDNQASSSVSDEAAILICNCLQTFDNMESLTLSALSVLSKMVILRRSTRLQEAASAVFTAVDVSSLIAKADNARNEAVDRAKEAEAKVAALQTRVNNLIQENNRLRREVSVLEASAAI
jgi:C-terminal region of Mon2 protein